MSGETGEAQRGQPGAPKASGEAFISYASHDGAVADAVCAALEDAGVTCWIAPRNVTPGEFYAESIVHAIDSAKVVVLVLSQHGAASQHVLREVERAASKRHPVVSLRIDAAALPAGLEYFLNSSQWLDAHTIGVDRALPRLVEATKSALAQPAATAPVHPGPATTARANQMSRRIVTALGAVIVAAVAYFGANKYWPFDHRAARIPAAATAAVVINDKSIAVLPFVDMSEKHDQEYFADGLSEELIDHLAHIAQLKVIARTSSFAFKGKNEDMRSIAKKLGVTNLLEGSVRKAGGELRITAQLIRASDGVHLWSEIYDRRLTDIFKVQDEISTTVAKALNVALNATDPSAVQRASNGTPNIEAYNLVLQGNHIWDRGNQGDNAKVVELYKQALNLDPHYALAWAKLARVYAWQGNVGELSSAAAEAKSRDAAQRALAIDPNCAAAYYARGNIFRSLKGDWSAAKSDYERAAELDPQGEIGAYAQTNILGLKATVSGRFGDILDWERRYLERNPLDTNSVWELAWYQFLAGHLDESAVTWRKLLDLNPASAIAQAQYGLTLLLMRKNSEALAAAQKESDNASKLVALACIYWAIGRRAESDAALGALERRFSGQKAYQIASVHAYRGDVDAAFAWLDRAYQQRHGSFEILKVDPLLRNLHADPRFDALLRRVKLVE